jgi:hypothetical protein
VASSHPDRTGAQAVDLSGGIVSFGAVVDAATDVDLYLLTRKLLLLQKGFWFCVNPSGRICMLRRLLSISFLAFSESSTNPLALSDVTM